MGSAGAQGALPLCSPGALAGESSVFVFLTSSPALVSFDLVKGEVYFSFFKRQRTHAHRSEMLTVHEANPERERD